MCSSSRSISISVDQLFSSFQPEHFSILSSRMTSQTVLLCVLALASFFSSALCSPMCNNRCCRFVEGFPVRLKKLRQDYSRIRDFYVSKSTFSAGIFAASPAFPTAGMLHFLTSTCQPLWVHGCLTAHLLFFSPSLFLQEANDDLDSALLDQSVEDSFKVRFSRGKKTLSTKSLGFDKKSMKITTLMFCSIRARLPVTP